MNKRTVWIGFKFLLSLFATAFAAQIAVALADPRFGGHVNQVAPVFGVALALLLVLGYRYLPAIFVGALIPSAFVEANAFSGSDYCCLWSCNVKTFKGPH
jgi:hypothetical protein